MASCSAVVGGELCRLLQRPLLGLNIFVIGNQLPVDVLHLVDGVENLLAECGVGDAPVVLGFNDEAAIDPRPKAVQQMLRQSRLKGGLQKRAVDIESVVRCNAANY